MYSLPFAGLEAGGLSIQSGTRYVIWLFHITFLGFVASCNAATSIVFRHISFS